MFQNVSAVVISDLHFNKCQSWVYSYCFVIDWKLSGDNQKITEICVYETLTFCSLKGKWRDHKPAIHPLFPPKEGFDLATWTQFMELYLHWKKKKRIVSQLLPHYRQIQ